ncbi:PDT-domain-containing protein [Amniculicola lignicola CBS 123094]|uniref:prephenate dehydratase n=1 Tax=Amniculicola lignicola CBS 123094 TaxID=1392246 RepID=A0A6A5WFD7_9PLEO|nr:PDT-domain-containing protein [Amniculicola lignicola CBS 123094]
MDDLKGIDGGERERGKKVVAFLGPRASYTHQATLDTFPESEYTLQPQITIEDVFSAVQSGSAYRGVVPFENSSNGSVVFTLDLFADLNGKYPDILVCDEAYIAVQHCLLGHIPSDSSSIMSASETSLSTSETAASNTHHAPNLHHGPPGSTLRLDSTPLESPPNSGAATPTPLTPYPGKPLAHPLIPLHNIKKIYSHPQAWGQCKLFLNTYLKGVERQDVSSTSRAAELVKMDQSGESAAVSSGIAARVMGLGVLARGIEDRGDNETRFFVLGRRGEGVGWEREREERKSESESVAESNSVAASMGVDTPHVRSGESQSISVSELTQPTVSSPQAPAENHERYKTLISFTISHSSPGSLAQSLAVFSKHGLNLTSINTRPSGVENWNYIFLVEIKGRREEEEEEERREQGGGKGAVNKALEELGGVCRGWRWLGSWQNRLLSREGR